MSWITGLTLGLFLLHFSVAVRAAEVSSSDPLKNAVIESQKKLGTLSPSEKKIFEEEVVPQYQRFIRDYRSSGPGAGLVAEIDYTNLKNYLRFSAPAGAKPQDTLVMTYLRAAPDCDKCKNALPDIKKMVTARLARRGLSPLWLSTDEVGGPDVVGKALDTAVVDLALKRSAIGAAILQWQIAPIDAIDQAHADEKRYFIRSVLQIRELGRSQGQLELQDKDSFENSAAQLLTDAFTEMGARAGQTMPIFAALDPGKEETVVEVSGIRDFSQYNQVKQALQEQLKDFASFEERKVAKGKITFALITDKKLEDLKARVSAAQKTISPLVQMEVR
jgi:hypothetical protein